MEIYVDTVADVTIASIVGELDGQTAPIAQDQILSLIVPEARILLDMTELQFMSSAGARTLLLIYRQIQANNGGVILAGLIPEIGEMLSATGFLDYFEVVETVDDGLALFGV